MLSDLSIPLYYQIVTSIKDEIEGSILKPGDRLATESSFCEMFKVSRATVRKAMEELISLDLIERRRKRGYYVKQIKMTDKGKSIRSLHDTLLQSGHIPSSKVISMTTGPCSPEIAKCSQCEPGKPMIKIKRLRLSDGKPLAMETIHMPADRFEGLNPWDMEKESLMRILVEKLGVQIRYSIHTLEPKIPTKEQMQHLNLQSKQPLLYIKSTLVDKNDEVVKYTEILYMTDVLEYSFTWENEVY